MEHLFLSGQAVNEGTLYAFNFVYCIIFPNNLKLVLESLCIFTNARVVLEVGRQLKGLEHKDIVFFGVAFVNKHYFVSI